MPDPDLEVCELCHCPIAYNGECDCGADENPADDPDYPLPGVL